MTTPGMVLHSVSTSALASITARGSATISVGVPMATGWSPTSSGLPPGTARPFAHRRPNRADDLSQRPGVRPELGSAMDIRARDIEFHRVDVVAGRQRPNPRQVHYPGNPDQGHPAAKA